ncbi:MAG: exo-alpha-sialidase [Verrucomicrobia bacterium]|nr:exo-alpha-sialidase [Verrucomicrobiota bacterium]
MPRIACKPAPTFIALVISLNMLGGAESAPRPKRPHVEIPPQLTPIATDPRFELTLGQPTVIMSGDGRQPYLFVSSQGTLFCQAQLSLPPFNSKPKQVYHTRIQSMLSRDGGVTWTPWSHAPNQDPVFIEGGMVERADGTILMLDTFIMPDAKKSGYGVGEIWKSKDDLRTVSGPHDAEFHLPHVAWSGSTNDFGRPHASARAHRSIVELPGGDLITSIYTRFPGDTAPSSYMPTMMKTRTIVARSRDGGATWAYLATVAVDAGVGTEGYGEPVLVRVSQGARAGRLLCYMRTGRDLFGAFSDDAGATWSRPLPVKIPGIDVYATAHWERRFADPKAPGYTPSDDMIGAAVDPEAIEMKDGTLVLGVGVRVPARKYNDDWRAPQNGNYLAFSTDGGDTWSHVVQFRAGAPTTHYMGVRELQPGLLYVVYDDSAWNMEGQTVGFQLAVKRSGVAPLRVSAHAALQRAFHEERNWLRVHAAEALIAAGEGAMVREVFLRELPVLEAGPSRIGAWRVLAGAALTPAERATCVAKIEQVFLTDGVPDRLQAIESLAKLGVVPSGAVLPRAKAMAAGPEIEQPFFWWALQHAGESGSLARLGELLRSREVAARSRAGYALRWLRPRDPALLKKLAVAVAAEPMDSTARPYLLSAALSLEADPARMAAWQREAEAMLATGPVSAQYELSQTLLGRFGARDAGRFGFLLDGREADTRIGGALLVLNALKQ